MIVAYLGAALIGAAIGMAELVARYRDAPVTAVSTTAGATYVFVNGLASFVALALIRQFGLIEAATADSAGIENQTILQVLVAGFGAMAVFRSSVLTVRVGNADIGVGPVAFLEVILGATDRACDRARAKPRGEAVQRIMTGVPFVAAKEALPTLCFNLMQNVSEQEQRTTTTVVTQIEASAAIETVKTNNLGLALMNVVGQDVLEQAVKMLRADLPPRPIAPIVQSLETLLLLRNADFKDAQQLIDSCLFLSNKMGDKALVDELAGVLGKLSAMAVSQQQKLLLLSAVLIGKFGESIVQTMLKPYGPKAPPQDPPPVQPVPPPQKQ